MADVRRDEEALWLGFDQHALEARWARAPEPHPAVVVVVVGVHDERLLVPDEEGGLAVAHSLAGLGQSEANAPQPVERIVLHASILPTRHQQAGSAYSALFAEPT